MDARKKGLKVGMIRPVTLWPFPDEPIIKAAQTARRFLSVEISMGQMGEDIRLAVAGKAPVDFYGRIGITPNPEEILREIERIAEKGGGSEKVVAKRPASLKENKFHYCPGCTHGIIHTTGG
jgi:2-oxoglutarate ferredoxin oxidoreductase subunit alpha